MNHKELINQAEEKCRSYFANIEEIVLHNTEKVLNALQEEGIAYRHFAPSTGYGYDDIGRDALERLYARVFGGESAIVRPHIASGTHAISLCLFGLLRPNDELIYATGTPYDTLVEVIGSTDLTPNSLRELGVKYKEIPLKDGKTLQIDAIMASLTAKTKVVALQRSRGYALRDSLLPEDFAPLCKKIHEYNPEICVLIDNCYGEFVCKEEPLAYGADVIVGSLIKNPGGGLAPTGGYIVGKEVYIEKISSRLTAPSVGREVGSYAQSYQLFYQGFFMAPHVVGEALKTALLFACTFKEMGYDIFPSLSQKRSDIIQAIVLGSAKPLIAFCEAIQMASPIDSMALPTPWAMPGYQHEVIMAAGTFVGGASIELSADAPLREPYAVYMQGALSYAHGKIALAKVLSHLTKGHL